MGDGRRRVVISEALNASQEGLGAGLEVVERPDLWSRREELIAELRDASALIVRNQTLVDAELVAASPGLRVVGRLGAGLDNIDVEALRERGVELVHGGGLNARAVAEYALGAALVLARRLAATDRQVRAGEWQRHVGVELGGRRLGVVGLGATGSELCRLGLGIGMQVLGYDPYLAPPTGVQATPLDALLRTSLVVSVHVPLVPATSNLIGAPELASMPAGAILINASRGGVVDEAALAATLSVGHLGGAALDVRCQEPPPADDPFRALDNVLLTPHLAGLTGESQDAIAEHVLAGVRTVITATT